MIYSPDVKKILTDVAVKEFGDLPWKTVRDAINECEFAFDPTKNPALAAVRLDLAVMDLRLKLQGVARLPNPEPVQ